MGHHQWVINQHLTSAGSILPTGYRAVNTLLTPAHRLRARLSAPIGSEALARMPQPCRVLVSGPASFNTAARGLLQELALDVEEQVTILSA